MLLLGITAGGCERGEDLMSMLGIMAGGCKRVEDLMSMLGITARGCERVEDLMLTLGITARGCEVMEADKAILVLLSTSLFGRSREDVHNVHHAAHLPICSHGLQLLANKSAKIECSIGFFHL